MYVVSATDAVLHPIQRADDILPVIPDQFCREPYRLKFIVAGSCLLLYLRFEGVVELLVTLTRDVQSATFFRVHGHLCH